MRKHAKILSIILGLLSIIFIPLLLFLKFDNYTNCQVVKGSDDEYIIIDKSTYGKLKDNKHLKLLQNKEVFKVNVDEDWTSHDDFYFARIKSNKEFNNEDLKIYINSKSLFNF